MVLCWLKKSPSVLKPFAAHRVAEIQTQLPQANWKHVNVPSEDNPADCTSRGLNPSQLKEHPLWWHGPPWLSSDSYEWPDQTFLEFTTTKVECKTTSHVHLQTRGLRPEDNGFGQLLQDVSTWNRLLRITAYVLRLFQRIKNTAPVPNDLALQVQEISAAESFWFRYAQKETRKKSPLEGLDPKVNDTGLIRLGGRLHQADIPTEQKHSVILSRHRVSAVVERATRPNALYRPLHLISH